MKKIFILTSILLIVIIGSVMLLGKNRKKQEQNNSNNITAINENEEEKVKEENKYSNEIFGKYYDQAEDLMKNMTIEEKVSQMFLVRYPEKGVLNQIKKHQPGGYILFGRDFDGKTKKQMTDELKQNQSASKIKMILGVDEEGRNSC